MAQHDMFGNSTDRELTVGEKFSILSSSDKNPVFTPSDISAIDRDLSSKGVEYPWKDPVEMARYLIKKFPKVDGIHQWVVSNWDYFSPIIRKKIK